LGEISIGARWVREEGGLEVLDPATGANRAHKVILGMI